MTEQALNQLTRRIVLDAARLEYGGLLEGAPEHTFSPAFERKMKKLLRRGRHPVLYRTLRAAACLLLVLLLSGCAVLVVSPAAREVFLGWVREFRTLEGFPPYYIYTYAGEEAETLGLQIKYLTNQKLGSSTYQKYVNSWQDFLASIGGGVDIRA